MKVLLAGNLTATAVEKDKKFVPAIDDGEHLWSFSSTIYSGRQNAVSHAQQVIDNLQKAAQNLVKAWKLEDNGPSREN